MRSEVLKEIFLELDSSSDVMEIFMSPNAPHLRISTYGNYGPNHVRIKSYMINKLYKELLNKDTIMVRILSGIDTMTD